MFAVADGETIYNEIKHQLSRYLKNEMTLDQFVFWFVPNTWDIQQTKHKDAIGLTYAIERILAEHSNGHRSEIDVRQLVKMELNERGGDWKIF